MFYALEIMTYLTPLADTCCHVFRGCAQKPAIPAAKEAKPGALAPKDKPLKLD